MGCDCGEGFCWNGDSCVPNPLCGNGVCDLGETMKLCPQDCAPQSSRNLCKKSAACVEETPISVPRIRAYSPAKDACIDLDRRFIQVEFSCDPVQNAKEAANCLRDFLTDYAAQLKQGSNKYPDYDNYVYPFMWRIRSAETIQEAAISYTDREVFSFVETNCVQSRTVKVFLYTGREKFNVNKWSPESAVDADGNLYLYINNRGHG